MHAHLKRCCRRLFSVPTEAMFTIFSKPYVAQILKLSGPNHSPSMGLHMHMLNRFQKASVHEHNLLEGDP